MAMVQGPYPCSRALVRHDACTPFPIPSLPHDLGFITAQYTDHPHYKDDGQLWKEEGDIDAFWRYNVTDCCITRIAGERMEQELHRCRTARHVP